MKKALAIILVIFIVALGLYLGRKQLQVFFFQPTEFSGDLGLSLDDLGEIPAFDFVNDEIVKKGIGQTEPVSDVEVVAENLNIPWEIVFLPSGQMLVTQRPGTLVMIDDAREKISISGVEHVGEGGLLGMALHPNFVSNNYIYLYLTTQSGGGLINRVERYRLDGSSLSDRLVIIDNIPGAKFHDGGRIEFGPDKKLYITTGDATKEQSAQNLSLLSGKILRLNDDGSVPADNPFGTAVYSYGHRNPQGLAWDDQARLWSTEHGRSGLQSGLDELNIISLGLNYGWPDFQGDDEADDVSSAQIHSGADATWAPAGAIYWDGSIFFAGLRGQALYEYNIAGDKLSLHFREEWGRLRAVVLGPDGFVYVSTSNTDGRGKLQSGDDKIIKINPRVFR